MKKILYILVCICLTGIQCSCLSEEDIPSAVPVTILSIDKVTATSVTYTYRITSVGLSPVEEAGVLLDGVKHATAASRFKKDENYTGTITGLESNTTYTIQSYAVNDEGEGFARKESITTPKDDPDGEHAGHAYVDLGLSVKWATMNVGATKPEGYGDYFAWGETKPQSDNRYSWSSYKWCNGSETTMTKYCTDSKYGTVDGKTVLDLADDAARANWGGSWRMPTIAEIKELQDNCTGAWTTQNGVKGYEVTSKKNGNSIFLPAAGNRWDGHLGSAGSYGNGIYWSSALCPSGDYHAYYLYFYSGNWYCGGGYRSYGQSVRAVCP